MTQVLFVRQEDGRVLVKPSVIYPHYFKVLGYSAVDRGKMETARAVFTEDLCQVLGVPLHIVIEVDKEFALRNFPVGDPPQKAASDSPFYKGLPGTPVTRLGIL